MKLWRITLDVQPFLGRIELLRAAGERALLGTSAESDVRIPIDTGTWWHIGLEVGEDGRVLVEDVGTSEHVYSGGERVERAHVEPGATVTVGSANLTLVKAAEDAGEASDWVLDVTLDDRLVHSFSLRPGRKIVVGRSKDCDVPITTHALSRRHFGLEVDTEGRVVVEDLGSTNGTWVNGQRCRRAAYASGVRVMAGQSILKAYVRPGG